MDQDGTDRAMYEKDLEELQRQTIQALTAATMRPLTADEAMLLAYCAGVPNEVYREIKHESK